VAPSQPAVAPQIQPPDEVADQPDAYDFEAESESSNEEHVQNASIIEELSTVVKELNRRVLVLELDARLKRREAELAAERNASSTSTPLKAVKHFDDRVNSAKAFRLKLESQAENAMQTARALSYFSQPPSSEASASRPPSNEVPS
jgi:outer membrane murein-binding lipoprotein Lpp